MTSSENPGPGADRGDLRPPRRRWRSIAFATALLLTGGILGAVLHHSAQAWPRGEAGPHGWFGGPHGMRGGPGFGGGMWGPSRVEGAVDRALWSVDASIEQRKKITAIAERAADDLFSLRDKHFEGRKQLGEVLAATTIDRAKIEALRAEQMKLAETASKRAVEALAEAAEVLTPAQRAELARRIEARRRWFRG